MIISKQDQEKLVKKKKLTNGDFALIYKAYYPKVLNFVNSRVTKYEDAQDLTSLVFERVMKKLPDFQWQGVTIISWIYTIARNAIIDFYRQTSERNKDSSLEKVGDFIESNDKKIEKVLLDTEEEIHLYNAMRELKDDDQFLIYYKFFEDLSNKEISEITGLSETNVGTRLHRLRTKIKNIINKYSVENRT